MFSASLRAILIALATTAIAVSAAPSLSLKVTGPDAVDGVENFKVITTVTNTGNETLKLLNDPKGVLSTLPAETFAITTDGGASPSFTGVRVKYSPTQAAKSMDPSAFTVLEAGATVSITHDISSAYNFTNTGHSSYTVAASNSFYTVNANNEVSTLSAMTAEPYSATLTGGNLVLRRPGLIQKRANFNGCSDEQQDALHTAAFDTYDLATLAWSYLDYWHVSRPRYDTWFGAYDEARHNTVLSNYRSIAGNDFEAFTYDCDTCKSPGASGYVHADEFGIVYLCGGFWNAQPVGAESKAGALLHLASHFTANGGTKDWAYGPENCKALAQSNPDRAVDNADSYQYFAENSPPLE